MKIPQPSFFRSNQRGLLLTGIGLVGLCFCWIAFSEGDSDESRPETALSAFAAAETALENGDYVLAERHVAAIDRDHRLWPKAQLIAGEAATRGKRYEEALEYYASIPQDRSPTSLLARFSYGEIARHVGLISEADAAYRQVLKVQPDDLAAHQRLAFLCGVTGRHWDSTRHYLALIKQRACDLRALAVFGDLERPLEEIDYLRHCQDRAPRDPLVQLGLAAHALRVEGASEAARSLLTTLIRDDPTRIAAQAMLGELLVDGEDRALIEWHDQLPSAAETHPDIWYVRGLWARRKEDLPTAARCFWESLRLVPEHRRSSYQLGQVLSTLERPEGAVFLERSTQLYELSQLLDRVLQSAGQDDVAMRRVAMLMETTGRLWEANGWAETSLSLNRQAAWPLAVIERVAPKLREHPPRTIDEANLAMIHDLGSLPAFSTLIAKHRYSNRSLASNSVIPARIRFAESPSGIDFRYENGGDPATEGARFFEQTGGGVGVLDLDQDGWPDLYFTQGGKWRTGDVKPFPSPEFVNRVFRNHDGVRFADVTHLSGLGDDGFGQGCAVNDFDNDGFDDVYVANVGRNRLYRNNGDGTFRDVTSASGIDAEEWTTSCVIVDLNADGFPDLFDVNYLTGPDIYTAICEGFACSPKGFEGVPDRLHLSRGDGTFEWVPDATPTQNAKGLGVVAIDLYEQGRPCLFIANDQVPNFLLRNVATDDARGVKFVEEGFLSGLAFDENGLPMACMGIAADDANGDGRTDCYVTNFKDEYNTLYLQDAEGLFVDGTSAAGLRAPSLPFVGWGTQFLDADLDGAPDLVLTNGHVDDYRRTGGQYHMRPQFFRNTGGGRFEELLAPAAGAYFAKEYVGRGLARLDWNKDGRMDFAVSNIGDHASLVTNQSTGVGQFVNVIVHATTTARDAIGAKVTVEAADGRRWTKMLCAGDGYQASNERVLQFGIGNAAAGASLRIEWPSGATTDVKRVPPGATLHVIENVGWHALHVKPAASQLAVR